MFIVLPLAVAVLSGLRPRRMFFGALCLLLVSALSWLPFYAVKPYPLADGIQNEEWAELSALLTYRLESEPLSDFSKNPPLCPTVRKASFSGLLRSLSIAGFCVPLTREAYVNVSEPVYTLPFVSFHEQAHQIGLADEGQAGIYAYLSCVSSHNPEMRMSGKLVALKYVLIAWNDEFPEEAASFIHQLPSDIHSALREIGTFLPSQQDTRARPSFAGDYGDLAPGLIFRLRSGLL